MSAASKNARAIVAISGVKNSGKTTLITRLVPELTARGHKVAVVKHDGHDFVPDVQGTDSYRYGKAGAYGCAVFSDKRFMVIKQSPISERSLFTFFPEATVILLEGFKNSPYPKIELVRSGNSDVPVCDPMTLIAVVTDLPLEPSVPVYSFDDIAAIADIIEQPLI